MVGSGGLEPGALGMLGGRHGGGPQAGECRLGAGQGQLDVQGAGSPCRSEQ